MKIEVFRTPTERAAGLQFRDPIPKDTLFLFLGVEPGDIFHTRNVTGPFTIVFLTADYRVLTSAKMFPTLEVIRAPRGTAIAIEAAEGVLEGIV